MRVLSIQQPWAWLIVNGLKDIENRDWPTTVRGEFLVHAGKRLDDDGYEAIRRLCPDVTLPPREQLERGGVVGQARIVDCVTKHPSRWFFGKYGFVLADAKPLPFTPLRGQLSFFAIDWPPEVAA